MKIESDSFRWMQDGSGAWLCVKCSQASRVLEKISPDKKYDIRISEHREKRSLDANAYCWVLIGKLSAKLGIPPDEIYQTYIRDVGGNYEIIPIKEDRVEAWDRLWCAGHLGRMTESIGPCRNTPGYINIKTYIGSSDYDTRQMARLINLVIQDCEAQGIPTITEKQRSQLIGEWDEKYGGK